MYSSFSEQVLAFEHTDIFIGAYTIVWGLGRPVLGHEGLAFKIYGLVFRV